MRCGGAVLVVLVLVKLVVVAGGGGEVVVVKLVLVQYKEVGVLGSSAANWAVLPAALKSRLQIAA